MKLFFFLPQHYIYHHSLYLDRDTETMTLRKASEGEQKRFAEQKLQMQGKLKDFETAVRKLERNKVDMSKDQGQRMQEENRLKAENAALEHRIKSLTDNYRSKLLEYLNENNNADGEGEEQRKAMMTDLTANYARAEEKHQRNIKVLRKGKVSNFFFFFFFSKINKFLNF